MPLGTIEGTSIRLQGAQTQREFLTEMALYQQTQSGETVRSVVKRFTPD